MAEHGSGGEGTRGDSAGDPPGGAGDGRRWDRQKPAYGGGSRERREPREYRERRDSREPREERGAPNWSGPDRARRAQPHREEGGSRPPRGDGGARRPRTDGGSRPQRSDGDSRRPRTGGWSRPAQSEGGSRPPRTGDSARPPRSADARSAHPRDESGPRRDDPPIPAGIEPKQLAPEVRRELSTLSKAIADAVACHLVAAGNLLDDDPQTALRHAQAARARSTRITAVREAVGIAAYHCGDWTQALGELRAARRMGSKSALLPLIADCERGLGRPQRAIELATGPEAEKLDGEEADELRIVVAGARADLGQLEQALTVLSSAPVEAEQTGSIVARLWYARAETLLALGRSDEALQWFLQAAAADVDGVTDAEERVGELAGAKPLAEEYDCLLLDLDGTAYCGGEPTAGAVDALAQVPGRVLFITNNSSRTAAQVAAHLTELGFTADAEDVATSAQIAAELLVGQLPAGAPVLVVGTDSLAGEIAGVGLTPVRLASEDPAAVVQGLSTSTAWADLAEAALAIRAGALWLATNVDKTLPSERGLLPGNGSLVAALRTATDVEPQVAGKPSAALLTAALARGEFYAPLVVGDRLDTDIAAANAAGLPSLMVLTGANSARDAVLAVADQRPTYLGADLRALQVDADRLAIGPQPGWDVRVDGATVTVGTPQRDSAGEDIEDTEDDGLSIVRAVAAAVWDAEPGGEAVTVAAADDTAAEALQRWDLLDGGR